MLPSQVSEIKQQAIIEKAQDPNSSVSAEAARETIVEETRKAGGTAFQFDPDATGGEKLAQLNAVCACHCPQTRPGSSTDTVYSKYPRICCRIGKKREQRLLQMRFVPL